MKKNNQHDLDVRIYQRSKHLLDQREVVSIVNILIDELIKELKAGKEIWIVNLGIMKLTDYKERSTPNIRSNNQIQRMMAFKRLHFRITRRISRYLTGKKIP